ncbi:MAG: peptidylprolyl isomerase [bacterium]
MKPIFYLLKWFTLLLRAFLRQGSKDFLSGVRNYIRWLKTPAGISFWSAFAFVLIIGSLSLIEKMRVLQQHKPAETERPLIPQQADPNPEIVKINNRVLRLSDITEYARQAGKLPQPGPIDINSAFGHEVIEEAVDQYLLADAARRSELAMKPAIRGTINIAINRILSAAYLEEIVSTKATEDKARAFYAKQSSRLSYGDEVRFRQMLIEDESLAINLMNDLHAGAEFAELAKEFSQDETTRAQGGEVGFFVKDQLPAEYTPLFTMKVGAYVGPIETERGYLILFLLEKRKIKPPPFTKVKDEIIEFLKFDAIDTERQRLRAMAEIQYYELPSPIIPPVPRLKNGKNPGKDNER